MSVVTDDMGARSGARTGRRVSPVHPPRRRTGAARGVLLAIALATAVLPLAGCVRHAPPRETSMPERPIADVLATHTPELMAVPGVVGTYQGALPDGRPCIVVMVVKRTPGLDARLPRTLEGWPVGIDESGEIRAMGDSAR
jgi:hypothetical protein